MGSKPMSLPNTPIVQVYYKKKKKFVIIYMRVCVYYIKEERKNPILFHFSLFHRDGGE